MLLYWVLLFRLSLCWASHFLNVMLNAIMLRVVMLGVHLLSVILLRFVMLVFILLERLISLLLCWMSACRVLLCWMSLCWVSLRQIKPLKHLKCEAGKNWKCGKNDSNWKEAIKDSFDGPMKRRKIVNKRWTTSLLSLQSLVVHLLITKLVF